MCSNNLPYQNSRKKTTDNKTESFFLYAGRSQWQAYSRGKKDTDPYNIGPIEMRSL